MNSPGPGPFVTKTLTSDIPLFYASAKFREQQIVGILESVQYVKQGSEEGTLVPAFPTEKNFFLADDITVTAPYSSLYENPAEYVGEDDDIDVSRRDTVHVYRTKKPCSLYLFTDPRNVDYLLHRDVNSPFHYSRWEKTVYTHSLSMLSYRAVETYFNEVFSEIAPELSRTIVFKGKNYLPDIVNSSYGLLLIATGFYYTGKGNYITARNSNYSYDYIIAEMFKEYMGKYYPSIAGWYQEKELPNPAVKHPGFHSEICIFDPVKYLTTYESHPDHWIQRITRKPTHLTSRSIKVFGDYLKTKRQGSAPMQLDELKQYYFDILDAPNKLSDPRRENVRKNSALQDLRRTPLQSFVNKTRNKCSIKSLCSSSMFGFDKYTEMDKMLTEMKDYKLPHNRHHVGKTVADHSLWVMRTLYNWIKYNNHPWTQGIPEELYSILLLSGFLHDIGKIGDLNYTSLEEDGVKADHPLRGFLYLADRLDFRVPRISGKTAPYSIVSHIGGISKDELNILRIVAKLHHVMGEVLMSYSSRNFMRVDRKSTSGFTSRYINGVGNDITNILENTLEVKYILLFLNIIDTLREFDEERTFLDSPENLKSLIRILCAVSAADVFGAYPVEVDDQHLYQPEIERMLEPSVLRSKTEHNEYNNLHRPYYVYTYTTRGVKELDNLMAYIDYVTVNGDIDVLLDAWSNLELFARHMKDSKNKCPLVFRKVLAGDTSSFLQNLLRLLKAGSINEQWDGTQLLPVSVKTEITNLDESLIELVSSHRVPGLDHEI